MPAMIVGGVIAVGAGINLSYRYGTTRFRLLIYYNIQDLVCQPLFGDYFREKISDTPDTAGGNGGLFDDRSCVF